MEIYNDNQEFLNSSAFTNEQKDAFIKDKLLNENYNYHISYVSYVDYLPESLQGIYNSLSEREKEYIRNHPFASIHILISTYDAARKAKYLFGETNIEADNNLDAFRHSYWNALMAKKIGYELAKEFADAHEDEAGSSGLPREMDLYNNEQGRLIGQQFSDLDEDSLAYKVLGKVCYGYMKRMVDNQLVSTNFEGLTRKYLYDYSDFGFVRINKVLIDIDGNFSVDEEIDGNRVEELASEAFKDQTGLQLCILPTTINTIGTNCFSGCTHITGVFANTTSISQIPNGTFNAGHDYIVYLPNNITSIGDSALEGTSPRKLNLSAINTSYLTYVGNNAFKGASLNKMKVPTNATYIGSEAFKGANPAKTVYISNATNYVGSDAFNSANINVFYVEHSIKPSNWASSWNSSNYPVVWGTNYSSDKSYVVSVNKTSGSLQNISSSTSVPDPERDGYEFGGWYTTPDCTGTSYELYDAPNGTLYADWYIKQSSGGSCVAEGTLVTLANGTQVPVETLKGNEELLVWDMLKGKYDSAPILFIDSEPVQEYRIIELTFSDGTKVKVIDEHAFFDVDIQEYVFLREDASMFIGHHFNKGNSTVVLDEVKIYNEYTSAWSPVTRGALCYYVNGLLSMPGNTEGFINIFKVEDMKVNVELMAQDINTYGLYTYEEFCAEVVEVPEEVFEAFNGQYIKVSFGKGLITKGEIVALFTRYSEYFVEETSVQVQTSFLEQFIKNMQFAIQCLLKGLGLCL
ncbi:MAG: leucine-rich repeat protein [Clostridia bacterium]|nr:leucine-rich repeat protein [Clostridia bacterium]